jgi:hypothetical protein
MSKKDIIYLIIKLLPWKMKKIDDNMVHGNQLNEAIDACMSLVCLYLWCLSPFHLLVFWCLEEYEQHKGPH